jgi:translation initiation factor IF-2
MKGSEEAIRDTLSRITHETVGIKIIEGGVGDITEADVKSAESTKAVIAGFRVLLPKSVELFARQRSVRVMLFELIYEFIAGIRKELALLLPMEVVKKPLGRVRLLAIFKREKDGIIIGGRVASGKAVRGAWCDIVRVEKIVGEGKIRELKIAKDDVTEVKEGQECGILFVGKGETPQVNDMVEVYEREERRGEL